MTMDARKQRVLQAIVALYGLEGEPVGSSVLANYFDIAVSSATLRNEMAALTKLGLLEQPHTSAGRVPSAKGYRYYLDNLLTDDQPLDRVTRARVDAVFASLDHEPEKLAQGAARALAAISGCTAAVSTPCAEDLCIAHYEVVQVGRSAAAVLAVTTAGYVRTRVARVRSGLSREKAAALAALLNHSLTFVAPVDLSGRMLAELCSQIDPELVREFQNQTDQTGREQVMEKFRRGELRVFVSTDVAARGIDVDDVDIVFNCDVPDENQDYVHRIGRTGRARRQGVAVTFISDYPAKMRIDDIAQKTRNEIVPVKFDEDGRLTTA